MSTFKVKNINKERNYISIEVTFDDGEKYDKRMMVSGFDEATIVSEVGKWLSDYEPLRKQAKELEKEKAKVKPIELDKVFKLDKE